MGPNNILCVAPSGTGKTFSCIISTLSTINQDINGLQALIVCSTRELMIDLSVVMRMISQFMNVITRTVSECIDHINSAHILVGTPKMLLQTLKNKSINTNNIRLIVYNDFDETICRDRKNLDQILRLSKRNLMYKFMTTYPSPSIDEYLKLHNIKISKIMMMKLDCRDIQHFYVDDVREE